MVDIILYNYMNEKLRSTPMEFKRYMADSINWQRQMIGIVGPRGIGKSIMILQRIKNSENQANSLYVSADHTYFSNHTLAALADDFVKEGGEILYIDEIHKYKGWSQELKQIYDVHPKLRVVFTGSSILEIQKGQADLSRRALIYQMQGLSFREYLELFHGYKNKVYTLEEILRHEVTLQDIEHPLPFFRDYCKQGYYPFAIEGDFDIIIEQVVAQTVEVDIPQFADMKAATARKLKRMLVIISQSAPYKPNYENLSEEVGVSKNNIADYLLWLEKAGMLGQLRDDTGGFRGLGKVEKVFVDNPSLMTALSNQTPNIGNIRETFFYNQMRVNYDVISSKKGDFVIGKNTFEVGGRKKGTKQIEGGSDGFIVKDDIETGHGIFIPLWNFGMTY